MAFIIIITRSQRSERLVYHHHNTYYNHQHYHYEYHNSKSCNINEVSLFYHDSYNIITIIITITSLLLATKLINVQVPFIFKSIVDSFEHHSINNSVTVMNVLTNSNVDTTPIVDIITTVSPVSLVLLYGISRSAAAGASELKVLS